MTVPDKKNPSIFGKQMLVAGVNNTAVKISSNVKIYTFKKRLRLGYENSSQQSGRGIAQPSQDLFDMSIPRPCNLDCRILASRFASDTFFKTISGLIWLKFD